MKRHFMLALVLTFCMMPLQSATLERLTLDDLITKSTAIVRAKVSDSYTGFSGPVIYTHYKLQLLERIQGQAPTEFVMPGGVSGGQRQTFPGVPVFQKGDEYVFFLWTGPDGITQVTGLTQGMFKVSDSATNPSLTREASHEVMLDAKTARPVKDETLVLRLNDLRTRIQTTLAAQRSAQ